MRFVLLLLLAAHSALAAPPMRGLTDGPHPDAPAELSQYAFIVGDWDCKTRFMGPDGSFTEGSARWSGHWILGGTAIQDIWQGGAGGFGTNLRSYNAETGKWDNRWLAGGQWKYYVSEQIGETMVMTGGEGKDPRGAFIDRNTFYEIEKNSWRWRKDRSYDGGKTWFEGVGFIEATRRSAK